MLIHGIINAKNKYKFFFFQTEFYIFLFSGCMSITCLFFTSNWLRSFNKIKRIKNIWKMSIYEWLKRKWNRQILFIGYKFYFIAIIDCIYSDCENHTILDKILFSFSSIRFLTIMHSLLWNIYVKRETVIVVIKRYTAFYNNLQSLVFTILTCVTYMIFPP